jgi:uncharacterized protein (DUF2235 family)
VVLIAGQISTYLLNGQAQAGLASSRSSLADFKTTASANQQLAEVHANVYRTVAIVGSLEDDKIKLLRADFGKQLDSVKHMVDTLTTGADDDEQLQKDGKATLALIDIYAKQADAAIKFSSVDANTGIAAMQRCTSKPSRTWPLFLRKIKPAASVGCLPPWHSLLAAWLWACPG